jgi:hypothetical protein
MRSVTALIATCAFLLASASPALAGGGGPDHTPTSAADRIEELQQELDSLTEDVDDLQEPVGEFDLFEECMYLIGVSERGSPAGGAGFRFDGKGPARRPALAFDMRGFGRPEFQFLAFPGEEPPSIECNEDAGQEETDG